MREGFRAITLERERSAGAPGPGVQEPTHPPPAAGSGGAPRKLVHKGKRASHGDPVTVVTSPKQGGPAVEKPFDDERLPEH